MKTESNIKLRFTQSPSGIISGIAFEENGHMVASFKLKVQGSSDYANDKSWSSLMLTMISGTLGAKVYDAFNGVLSEYGESDIGCQTWRIGRTRCLWRIRNDKMKKAIEEIRKTLEKEKFIS